MTVPVPVCVLPGLDGSGQLHDAFIAAMRPSFATRVIRYPADRALDYAWLEDLVRPLLPADRLWLLLGESFSGPVAIRIAAFRPSGLAGLVLCASFARSPRPLLAAAGRLLRLPLPLPPTRALMPWMMGRWTDESWTAALAQALDPLRADVARKRLHDVLHVDVCSALREVACPILYLQASADRLVPSHNWQTVRRTARAPCASARAPLSAAGRAGCRCRRHRGCIPADHGGRVIGQPQQRLSLLQSADGARGNGPTGQRVPGAGTNRRCAAAPRDGDTATCGRSRSKPDRYRKNHPHLLERDLHPHAREAKSRTPVRGTTTSQHTHGDAMSHGSYNLQTVALSFLIAWFAGFVALQLAGRVRNASRRRAHLWVWAGGLVFGLGIWSMHFTGMLAFHVGTPLHYDITLTAVSVVPAVLASALALHVAGTRRDDQGRPWLAAALMTVAICAMHYIGMAAITFSPRPHHAWEWVAASFLIAGIVSMTALQLMVRFSWSRSRPRFGVQTVAAALMGLGVCGMHYTGMAALRLDHGTISLVQPGAVSGQQLSVIVISIALFYLAAITIGSQHDLHASERRFSALVDGAPTAMLLVDRDGIVTLANAEAERLLGYARGALSGQSVDLLSIDKQQDLAQAENRRRLLHTSRPVRLGSDGNLYCRHHDGHPIPVEVAINPLLVQGHRVLSVAINDLSERLRSQQQIARMAYYDELTGLPNRGRFMQQVEGLLARGRGNEFSLMFADLDGFKEINDSLGHSAGDRVLQHVAERMRSVLGMQDQVFRFGGDEFIVLLAEGEHRSDSQVAAALIQSVGEPFQLDGSTLRVGLSLGSVRHPVDGDDTEQLLKRADNALYHAKAAGKALHLRFNAAMEASVTHRFGLVNDLRGAVGSGQLQLLYQPVVCLQDALPKVIGAEALVYWHHPVHGLISPATFIPIAEECGVIESLGEWVLEEAVAQAAHWRNRGLPPLRMAVNVSGIQFRDRQRLRNAVCSSLEAHQLPPQLLELEITERQLMHDPRASMGMLETLSDLGVAIALDDFGTGYSSFNYLRDFSFDKLKIDRSFIDRIDSNSPDGAIVRAMAEVGRALGMVVVAEGVERTSQLPLLREARCVEAQGYLFGRPMPADQFCIALDASMRAQAPAVTGMQPGAVAV